MSEKSNGLSWHAVTQPQSSEAKLKGWRDFLESKGIETRVVREGNGFTLERYGVNYFTGEYQP